MGIRRYFEWIAGEMVGEVEVLESIETIDGEVFYNFESGERCNLRYISKMTSTRSDLKEKFMVEIASPSNPWTFETVKERKYIDGQGIEHEVPTLHDILQANGSTTNISNSDIGKQQMVAPKNPQNFIPLPDPSDYPVKIKPVTKKQPQQVDVPKKQEPVGETISANENVVQDAREEPIKKFETKNESQQSFNPIHLIVDSCKKKETEVSLDLNIMLPSRSIYKIAADEFEDGVNQFIDYVVQNIDTKIIIDELKIALIQAYQNVNVPTVSEQ